MEQGKLVGPKALLEPKDVWAIRAELQNGHCLRERAMLVWVRAVSCALPT